MIHSRSKVDLNVAVTCKSINAINESIPNFPSETIKTCFKQNGVHIEDIGSIPKQFSKYFAVMAGLADGNLQGKRLLDVGSGLGVFVAQAKSLGMISTGIDIFIEYQGTCHRGAMCIYKAYGHSLDDAQRAMVNHDITKSPIPGKMFDFITSFGMLEHIFGEDARRNVVHNMMKSLTPGGSLILTCGPNKYFPIDLYHYGPKFVFYHCLPVWARRLYLHTFAKPNQCMDPKWLNGMRITEIKRHIFEFEPAAHIVQVFPLWVHCANSKWLQPPGVRGLATAIARITSALNFEPVIILVATRPFSK